MDAEFYLKVVDKCREMGVELDERVLDLIVFSVMHSLTERLENKFNKTLDTLKEIQLELPYDRS